MKATIALYRYAILLIVTLSLQFKLFSQVISSEEFANRQKQLLALTGPKNAVVLKSAGYKVRSADVAYRYRQESNFLYLSGIKKTNSILLFVPQGFRVAENKVNVLLFDPEVKKDSVVNSEHGVNEAVVNSNRFDDIFNSVIKNTDTLFVSAPDLGFANDWLNNRRIFIERDAYKTLQQKFPGLKIKSAAALIAGLREIKSNDEAAIIKKAVEITGKGIERAMKICKPGMWEYELRAAIEYEMLRSGCDYPAFPSIIGSGENSLILHYEDDNMKMEKDQVVVMDVGAELEGYSADVTRTIPVTGRFTKAQKEIYELVLKANEEIIKIIRPGIKFRDLDNKAIEIFKEKGLDRYLPHSVSHSVGLDTHDVTSGQELKSGMVITVEPGLYFPKDETGIEPEYRGFGIRIEDDVLVTADGCEVISKNIPKTVREIESIMSR